ncbi:MAG: phospho-N-acetylmuramoyl-pentapeptide-transferase [Bacteroidota bacterium]
MLYHLFTWLEATYQPPGFQVFQFSTVRAGLASGTALLVALFAGKKIIRALQRKQLGEVIREGEDAGVVSHTHKAGTPTMGGVILLLSLFSAVLLWADLTNPYVWIALVATGWMGAVGFADDYIKVIKKDKDGIAPKVKLAGQLSLGVIVSVLILLLRDAPLDTVTSLPFVPNGLIDYDILPDWGGRDWGWVLFIPIITFILTGVSNAVNLTDGLDGLAAGIAAFSVLAITVMAFITGNANLAEFVNDVFLPGSSELVIFGAALSAACFGFLWYNGHPAQVFMGDTGSLALGAAIGTLAILIKKELYLPLVGAIFFAETLSVIIQTSYFKYTRKKYGEGRRVFRMAPLHHHYEAKGTHESKIVIRFWIVTALMAILTLFLFRIR